MKKPSSSKKKVKSRSAKTTPANRVKPKQTDKSQAKSTAGGSEPLSAQPPVSDKTKPGTAPQSTKPASTTPSEPGGMQSLKKAVVTAPSPEQTPPVAGKEAETPTTSSKQPPKQSTLSSPTTPKGGTSDAQQAPSHQITATNRVKSAASRSPENKDEAPLPIKTGASEPPAASRPAVDQPPAAEAKTRKPDSTTAPGRGTQETPATVSPAAMENAAKEVILKKPQGAVAEKPVVEPKPAGPEKREEAPRPIPMPAEAESVHVEEPVPDEPSWELPPEPHRPELFIVHISPEMAPVAKVGGLADVVFGLTGELAIRGNHVEIILPKYDNLRYDHIYEVHEVFNDLWVPWYDGAIHCTVFFGFVHGRKCFFIEPHSQDNFFNRGSVYGFPDDIMRFAFFSRAAMEFLWKSGKHPDIIHCHDWQTALVPVLMYEIYQKIGMHHPRACFTIHNYKHQGVTGMELLRATGLHDPDRYFDYNRLRDNNHPNALNLLKGGIVYSNFVTTVSPHYAMETKDQGQGFGLEPTLHTHHMKYGGVLNGIDYNVWNPEVDHLIPVRYGADTIDGKYDNKRALRHRLMLADNEKPIVAFIGRLDPQKGLELVRHAIFQSLERGAQVVLLGSSPDHAINADFWNLKNMLNDSHDCHLEIGYDEELSHLIYAGADIMLVPSQFEPCGLTQLISLRYGTIPVVRAVGGLADTVFDKDHSHRPLHERNGYVFDNYDYAGLESALIRAIDCFYQYPEHFRDLIRNAMRTDYSWNLPGQDYMNIYDYIRNK